MSISKIKQEFRSSEHVLTLEREGSEKKYAINVSLKEGGKRSIFSRYGEDVFKFNNSKPEDIEAIAELLIYASKMEITVKKE